jgi:hypothetical protein
VHFVLFFLYNYVIFLRFSFVVKNIFFFFFFFFWFIRLSFSYKKENVLWILSSGLDEE